MYTFNKKSWHYRLAAFGGGMPSWETNLCPYVRLVIKGFFWFCVAWFLAGVFLIANVLTIVSMFQGFTPTINNPAWFYLFSYITVALLLVLGGMALKEHIEVKGYTLRKKNDSEEPKIREPNLIAVWLKSVHNKICPQIEFKE